jgi:hypothetical protein
VCVSSSADDGGNGGIGMLISPSSVAAFEKAVRISHRIMVVHFRSNSKKWPKVVMIVVHSPTSVAKVKDVDDFYIVLNKTIEDLGRHSFLCILGDWNARLLCSSKSPWVFSEQPNKNSDAFKDFLALNGLFSTNCVFQKNRDKLWTHRGPRGHKSQIDHIVFCSRFRSSVRDSEAFTFQGFKTDHRIVVAKLQLSLRVARAKPKILPRYDWKSLKDDQCCAAFVLHCKNRFASLQFLSDNENLQSLSDDENDHSDKEIAHKVQYTNFSKAVQSAAEATLPTVPPFQRKIPWADDRIVAARLRATTAKKRHCVKKSVHSKNEVCVAMKALSDQYVSNQREYIEAQIKQIVDADESRKASAAWKAINNLSGKRTIVTAKITASSPQARLDGWLQTFHSRLNNPIVHSQSFEVVPLPDLPGIRTGPFDYAELEAAAKQMKQGKACGVDGIPSEIFRIPEILQQLLPILNATYTTHNPPSEFLLNKIIVLPKKGDLTTYDAYRGISLMSCTAKLYNRLLLNRIRSPVEPLLRQNQNGFRPSRTTIEPILALRRLIEELSCRKGSRLAAIFVDFTKAFDSVDRPRMFQILSAYGIPEETIAAIRVMYDGSTAFVSTVDGDTDTFPIETGVLQGDTLAPFLFIVVVDYLLRQAFGVVDNNLGIQVKARKCSREPAKHLTDFDYADDIAVLGSSRANAQTLLNSLVDAAAAVGLKVNAKKTKALVIGEPVYSAPFHIGTANLEEVDDFSYLGSWVKSSAKALDERKGQAWTAASQLWKIWRADIGDALKRKVFRATVESVLLYGADTWSLTAAQLRSLDGTYTRLLRKALNVHFSSHTTNEKLYGGLIKPSVRLAERRLRLAGHCFRRTDQPVSDLVLYQPGGKFEPGGHSRMTFLKRIKADSGISDTQELARKMKERETWRQTLDRRLADSFRPRAARQPRPP